MAGPPPRLPLPRGRVPAPCAGRDWLLEPQSLAHNERDYAAVMAAREHLRAWSHSDWPGDDFTLAANAEDLAGHIDDARQGLAYGYSVFASDRSELLGSLYLNPTGFLTENYQTDEATRLELAAALVEVDYWLVPAREADFEFHRDFALTVDRWLRTDWGYARPLWGSRRAMGARRDFYAQIGWSEWRELQSKSEPGRRFWLHGASAPA
ncbi:MAG: hypothetical protein H3C27_08165 [Opitutaceae bacterium]|nr:hypothetical protein [Opitutaceae bacterium]